MIHEAIIVFNSIYVPTSTKHLDQTLCFHLPEIICQNTSKVIIFVPMMQRQLFRYLRTTIRKKEWCMHRKGRTFGVIFNDDNYLQQNQCKLKLIYS